MKSTDQDTVASLQSGKVTYKIGHGKSMQPKIMDGHRQTLVPILAQEEAETLGCKHWEGQVVKEGDLFYIRPDEVRVGDAVFCKPTFFYTHEVHKVGGKSADPEFLIGRHDRKRMNGWTRKVYGKCVHSEKA